MTPAEARQKMLAEGYSAEEVDKAIGAVVPATPPVEATESFARGAKQGLTAGWGDEGSAAIAATLPMLDPEAAKGQTWEERYRNARDFYRGLDKAAQKANRGASIAGEVVGGLAPISKITGAAKGWNLLGRNVAYGAGAGAGASEGGPGSLAGGIGLGALGGALATLPVAALDKLPALKSWLQNQARIEAFKQAAAGNAKSVGGRLAREAGQGRAQQVGQFMLDKGVLSKGDAPADILAAAQGLKGEAGTQIGQAIKGSGAKVNLPDLISKIEQGPLAQARAGGSLYGAPFGHEGGGMMMGGIAPKIQGVVDDLKHLQATMGDDVPASVIHGLKVKHANVIDWASDRPLAEALQRVVGTEAGAVTRAVKTAGAGEPFKAANVQFGLASDLEKAAAKGAEAIGNRQLGLSELGTGSAGAVVGALVGGGPGAAVGSAAGGLAANYWRKHGSGIAARSMSSLSDIVPTLEAMGPRMAPYADLFRRTIAATGPAAAASLHFELWDKDPTYRQGMQNADKPGGE